MPPAGDVVKGQWFVGVVEQSSKPPTGTPFNRKTAPKAAGDGNPKGRWRDGLCDCCVLGKCHSVCCMSCFCGPGEFLVSYICVDRAVGAVSFRCHRDIHCW
jgi:hypothetical protein